MEALKLLLSPPKEFQTSGDVVGSLVHPRDKDSTQINESLQSFATIRPTNTYISTIDLIYEFASK